MTTRRRSLADRPTLRISAPPDLARMVPFLLGFRPEESLVLVGLADKAIVVTVRIDLADLVEDAPAGVLASTIAAMVHGGAKVLMGVVYDDRAEPDGTGPLPWHGLAEAVATEATLADTSVNDLALVSCGRWWSFTSEDPDCLPGGVPLDDDSSSVEASAAYAGLVALPDRAALAALLEPEPAELRELLVPRLDDAVAAIRTAPNLVGRERALKRELFAAARSADEPGPGFALDDDDVVRFGAALAFGSIRDAAWLAIDDERLDGREFWRVLGRRLPGRHAAPPMFYFGWASWRAGNGAFARIAAERALDANPDYSPAELLLAALSRGFDPRQVPKLRQRTA